MDKLEWNKVVYLVVFLVVGALVGLNKLEPAVLVAILAPSPLSSRMSDPPKTESP